MGLDKRVTYRRRKSWKTPSNNAKIVRTPGNRHVLHYKKRKVSGPRNPHYLGGAPLAGLKALRPSKKRTCGAAAKKVNRPYGGVLSHDLVRERIVRAFLIEEQKIVKKVLKMKKVPTA